MIDADARVQADFVEEADQPAVTTVDVYERANLSSPVASRVREGESAFLTPPAPDTLPGLVLNAVIIACQVEATQANTGPKHCFRIRGIEAVSHEPKLFANLRAVTNVTSKMLRDEWCLPPSKLNLTLTSGRSGALFLLSRSRRFLLKTISPKEVETALSMLPDYVAHVATHLDSALMRLISLVTVFPPPDVTPGKSRRAKPVHALVFESVTWRQDGLAMTELYDLKGRVPKKTIPSATDPVLLGPARPSAVTDKWLRRTFPMVRAVRERVIGALRRDIGFLSAHNIMDYSVLVGVRHSGLASPPTAAGDLQSAAAGRQLYRDPRCFPTGCGEEMHVGIIDCVTSYSKRKVAAHTFKRFRWTSPQLSTVPADVYATRCINFIEGVFVVAPPNMWIPPVAPPKVLSPSEALAHQTDSCPPVVPAPPRPRVRVAPPPGDSATSPRPSRAPELPPPPRHAVMDGVPLVDEEIL